MFEFIVENNDKILAENDMLTIPLYKVFLLVNAPANENSSI